ncbi:hypothetical protein [Haloparvum sp. AD34]
MTATKSTAQRAFSVFIAGLLISSVVAPAALSGTAAAQTSDDGVECSWDSPLIQLVGDSCHWDGGWETVNDSADRDAAYVQSDHHAELRGEYETAEQFRTVFENYGEDTGTIASLEARNAIATAYQNNQSASTADAKAQTAIQDYYSIKEINTLEAFSKQQAQIAYSANSTRAHPDTSDDFVYPQHLDGRAVYDSGSEKNVGIDNKYVTGNLVNKTYTLSNGSTHQYKVAELYVKLHQASAPDERVMSGTVAPSIQDFQGASSHEYQVGYDGTVTYYITLNGLVNVRASYAGTNLSVSNGHPAQVIEDRNSWASTMTMWSNQSDTMESNYQAGTASDLYGAMDDGRLDPDDVRGAEGQVRYLSGDSNATSQRYKAALYGTLDMEQAGFNSTFTVEYTGYTEAHYNRTTDGNRTVEYSGYVENKTFEGMVFSSEVPAGGFEQNSTYNTENLNGTTMIYSQNNGTVTFAKGNVTFVEITDTEGNQVENVTWSDPKYDTNDVSEYIDYLNETQTLQMQLLEQMSDDGSGTGGSGFGGISREIVLLIIAAVAAAGILN